MSLSENLDPERIPERADADPTVTVQVQVSGERVEDVTVEETEHGYRATAWDGALVVFGTTWDGVLSTVQQALRIATT